MSTTRPRSSVTEWMPSLLGHHRVVPSPSSMLASDVLGADPELAVACAPMATLSPSGMRGSALAVVSAAVLARAEAGCAEAGWAAPAVPAASPATRIPVVTRAVINRCGMEPPRSQLSTDSLSLNLHQTGVNTHDSDFP